MKIFGRVIGGLRQLRRSPKWQGDGLKKRVLTRWSVPWSLDTTVCGLCGLEACSAATNALSSGIPVLLFLLTRECSMDFTCSLTGNLFYFGYLNNNIIYLFSSIYIYANTFFFFYKCHSVSSGMKLGGLYGLCHIYRPPPDMFYWQFSRTSFSYGLVGLSLFGGAAFMFSSHLTSFEEYAENDSVKLRMLPYCTNLAAGFTFIKVNVAAVVEEVVYRGFLLTSLTKWVATPTALLLSSAAFGLSHVGAFGFNFSFFSQHFFFGLFSGVVFLYSRNLCAPIVVHSVYNSAMFLYYLLEFKRVCLYGFDEFDEQDLIRLFSSKSVTSSAPKPSSSKIKGKKPLEAPERRPEKDAKDDVGDDDSSSAKTTIVIEHWQEKDVLRDTG
ncbi:uncharacterized protein LOC110692498 [Chenopodium quinoa]|uniref:uncharacterized protein LOC110692498 n=1 Tax=Chenopodium quinoa TaxID=63459 RepID=UPI000B7781F5|nr:uncharacterized protein LOC110692498 [Chenopodium quinoa]